MEQAKTDIQAGARVYHVLKPELRGTVISNRFGHTAQVRFDGQDGIAPIAACDLRAARE